jgi:dihydrolipoamide dehydrogenase
MDEAHDVVVIGAGTAGYSAALRAAELELRVVLVERDERLGGTCLLRGCIPTKALLRSAEVVDTVNRAADWGVKASGEPDWSAIRAFEESIVDKNVKGLTGLVKMRGIDVVRGQARLLPGAKVELNGKPLDAKDVIIATGSQARLLRDVDRSAHVITSDEALVSDAVPTSAIVIGAGAVGLEFASLYRSFGADVTLLEALPVLAPLEDAEVSKEIARAYRKRGIECAVNAVVEQVKETGEGAEVTYTAGRKTSSASADVCLIATGRGPVTDGLGLEEAGVSVSEKGLVQVDAELRTSVEHVWAIGDVADTPYQLAHVAFDEGYAVAERIAGQESPPVDYPNVPRVTYCSPEIASVGLTEAQVREQALDVDVEKLDFRAIAKANIVGEAGFVKVVALAGGGPVLGVHMIGPHVTDLVAEAMLITSWEATAADVAVMHHPHPTLSEGIGEAMLKLAGAPLHSP